MHNRLALLLKSSHLLPDTLGPVEGRKASGCYSPIQVIFKTIADPLILERFLAANFQSSPSQDNAQPHIGAAIPPVDCLSRKLPNVQSISPKMALS